MVQKLTHCLVYALLAVGLTACLEDKCEETQTFTIYQPVTVAAAEFRTTIGEEAPRELCRPGNIYYYKEHLLIVEQREGIHIFDNADPSDPRAVSFLPIEGITDMAVRNDVLYANHYIDLVAFDISNPEEPTFLGRTEGVFDPYSTFVDDAGRQQFVVEYLPTTQEMTINCSDSRWGQPQFWVQDAWFGFPTREVFAVANSGKDDQAGSGSGIGGSLARFTIAQGHLYTVDDYSLHVFDLTNAAQPVRAVQVPFGFGIETIFPYGDKLFIGSMSGMYIFDAANALQPVQIGYYGHANACDPVYVSGNRAYVTLRDGTECQTYTNQLDVVDITNLNDPQLITSHQLHHPIGLSVDGNQLFICDDEEGLKVFDRTDDKEIINRIISRFKNVVAHDVITLWDQDVAIVVGPEGLTQIDYSDPNQLRELSRLAVCPE